MTPALLMQRAALRMALSVGAIVPPSGRDAGLDPAMAALLRFARHLAKPDGPQPALGAIRTRYAGALGLTGLRAQPGVTTKPFREAGCTGLVFDPAARASATLLYFHGGGFVMGSPATHAGLCQRLAALTGMRVVSAAYRLAPEHPFPAAHDDAAAALDAVRSMSSGPIIVGGDSAGANLAASLALDGRVAGQVLLYPVVDMAGTADRYPSLQAFGTGFLLTAAGMEQCAVALIPPGTDRAAPRLSPIGADLGRAAPAIIATAGFDPLRDQGRAYARALQAAGRPAQLIEAPGLVHGYADFAGVVPAARHAVDRLAMALQALALRAMST